MGDVIVKHRRGTTAQWATSNIVPYEGEIVLEKCNDGLTRLKVGDGINKYSSLPYINTPGYATVVKKTTISLSAASWSGTGPYFQSVNITNTTANSKVDLQPTPEVLSWLQDQKISLMAVNDGGTIKIYAINGKPSQNLTIQATVSETTDQ